jgi:hypothetical protein
MILKNFSDELSLPLSMLFNKSPTSNTFPEKWKIAKITPIFKSGNRDDISSYRGISCTSSIPKLFEAVICNAFKNIVSKHISVSQHGFMPGRSTTTNLTEFTNKTIKALENHMQVDSIYTDFSKAFDSISHCKTLENIYDFGFSSSFVLWVKSYLMNRHQYVEIGGKKSILIKASSGVPQGSHLGPWFFIIFINSIVDVIKGSSILMFADDLKIFRIIQNENDALVLQTDVDNLCRWCNDMKLSLNISKCKSLSFHRKSNPIIHDYKINNIALSKLTEHKDLGVTFTQNMSFNKHIDLITAKANSMFGFMKRWAKDLDDIHCILVTISHTSDRNWNTLYLYGAHITKLTSTELRISKKKS